MKPGKTWWLLSWKNDMKPGKNLVANKNSPLTPLKQYKIYQNYLNRKEGSLIWSIIEMINFLFK